MSILQFSAQTIMCAPLGRESGLPDIMTNFNVQNRTKFMLDETDEIYEGYGQLDTAYPYRKYTCYSRELQPRSVKTAVLENKLIRAVFLPEFGGRLCQLTDKTTGQELLYTNDVLRASNLAVRDAWFSGGVEWNVGVIGHTPLTMDPVFAAKLTVDKTPILRMYAYERIRQVTYQMDFWLDNDCPALNCHFTVSNQNQEVVPMYWWSNIASPVYKGGRLFVPSNKAYTHTPNGIVKCNVPTVDGLDISHYESIATQRDFFFAIDSASPKWIANASSDGKGLLHTSTSRLQSRKLFVWGNTDGACRWQEFLTEKAGPYLEIQAGIGKTQYGCIPMAPNTTWQWTERYEPLNINPTLVNGSFDKGVKQINDLVLQSGAVSKANIFGEAQVKALAKVVCEGNGDAALENQVRQSQGLPLLRPHLAFSSSDMRQAAWHLVPAYKSFSEPPADVPPSYDVMGKYWLEQMKVLANTSGDHWYVQYNIALLENDFQRFDLAMQAINKSLEFKPTAWAHYVKSVFLLREQQLEKATLEIIKGMRLCANRLDYSKAAFAVLEAAKKWDAIANEFKTLPESLQSDSRLRFYYAQALYNLRQPQEALDILQADKGLLLADIRECDKTIGILWRDIQLAITGKKQNVPHFFNFNSVDLH